MDQKLIEANKKTDEKIEEEISQKEALELKKDNLTQKILEIEERKELAQKTDILNENTKETDKINSELAGTVNEIKDVSENIVKVDENISKLEEKKSTRTAKYQEKFNEKFNTDIQELKQNILNVFSSDIKKANPAKNETNANDTTGKTQDNADKTELNGGLRQYIQTPTGLMQRNINANTVAEFSRNQLNNTLNPPLGSNLNTNNSTFNLDASETGNDDLTKEPQSDSEKLSELQKKNVENNLKNEYLKGYREKGINWLRSLTVEDFAKFGLNKDGLIPENLFENGGNIAKGGFKIIAKMQETIHVDNDGIFGPNTEKRLNAVLAKMDGTTKTAETAASEIDTEKEKSIKEKEDNAKLLAEYKNKGWDFSGNVDFMGVSHKKFEINDINNLPSKFPDKSSIFYYKNGNKEYRFFSNGKADLKTGNNKPEPAIYTKDAIDAIKTANEIQQKLNEKINSPFTLNNELDRNIVLNAQKGFQDFISKQKKDKK